jgi:mRNA-degrading endonuclease toxin of MazEF toxin-antitoxin module
MAAHDLTPGSVISVSGTGGAGRESGSHKCIIVADDLAKNDWLLVPICSFHNGADSTCTINPSDETGLVERKSYIAYYQCKMVPKGKSFVNCGKVSPEFLQKVRAGINASSETEPWFKEAYNKILAPKKAGRVLRSGD